MALALQESPQGHSREVESPSSEECSPGWTVGMTGQLAEGLAPTQEQGLHSPPLTWECGRIPGIRHRHTPTLHPLAHISDYTPRT